MAQTSGALRLARRRSWMWCRKRLRFTKNCPAARTSSSGDGWPACPPSKPARAGEVLEALSLADRAREPVKHYSGGMKRRINIGCGLISFGGGWEAVVPKLGVLALFAAGADIGAAKMFKY